MIKSVKDREPRQSPLSVFIDQIDLEPRRRRVTIQYRESGERLVARVDVRTAMEFATIRSHAINGVHAEELESEIDRTCELHGVIFERGIARPA